MDWQLLGAIRAGHSWYIYVENCFHVSKTPIHKYTELLYHVQIYFMIIIFYYVELQTAFSRNRSAEEHAVTTSVLAERDKDEEAWKRLSHCIATPTGF